MVFHATVEGYTEKYRQMLEKSITVPFCAKWVVGESFFWRYFRAAGAPKNGVFEGLSRRVRGATPSHVIVRTALRQRRGFTQNGTDARTQAS
ncbi:MAG: hypothetical protein AVDCRST_MAG56-4329 [uncultured Cytophagales bacterium]|uniref:Uncharacterized protein n=1 Tax=uncultured Cytophagales bacterium TaxID=158755 RepID=A0A6J4JV65_9SPHI|nr:MAG: hypothetical protein AVDCRST_MAG56-4329 [uncultured Cytophagales bacterium]